MPTLMPTLNVKTGENIKRLLQKQLHGIDGSSEQRLCALTKVGAHNKLQK